MPKGDCEARNICAVVITFHPEGDIGARLRRIAPQVGGIIVVDNRSDDATVAIVQGVLDGFGGVLIPNQSNLGVATALNQGVRAAKARGFQRALLLDQDTVVGDNLTGVLCGALAEHPAPERVAVVGSNYLEVANGRRLVESPQSGSWISRPTVITSGSLVSIEAFEWVGGFRDELFIDEVDTDFCFRARALGYEVIVATTVTMEHRMGDAHEERRFLWRTVRPVNYSATRWYYIARNTVVLAGEHWRGEPRWVRANVYGHLKWLAKALIYEDGRWSKGRAVVRGIAHGLRRRLGPHP